MKQHIETVHEGKKPHQCSICGNAFGLKQHLKRHISLVHEKNKPFKCCICDFTCGLKDSLTKHISAVHEKKKPYKCSNCNTSFATGNALKAASVGANNVNGPVADKVPSKEQASIAAFNVE